MRRTPIVVTVVAIAVIGAAVIATPLVFGHVAKGNLGRTVEALDRLYPEPYGVRMDRYDMGLFSSAARIVFSVPAAAEDRSTAERLVLSFIATVSHGPVAVYRERGELAVQPARAAIDLSFDVEDFLRQNPGEGEALANMLGRVELPSTLAGSDLFPPAGLSPTRDYPPPRLLLVSRFDGRSAIEGWAAPLEMVGDGVTIRWDGGQLSGSVSDAGDDLQLDMDITPVAMEADTGERLEIGRVRMSAVGTGPLIDYFFDSEVEMSVDQVVLSGLPTGFTLGRLDVTGGLKTVNETIQISYGVELAELELDQPVGGFQEMDVRLGLQLYDLDRPALVRFMGTYQEVIASGVDPDEGMATVVAAFQEVLAARPSTPVRLDLDPFVIALDAQAIDGSARFAFLARDAAPTPLDGLTAEVTLESPADLIASLIAGFQVTMVTRMQHGAPMPSRQELSAMTEMAMVGARDNIAMAVASGWVEPMDDRLRLHAKLADGQMVLNGRSLDLPWLATR